MSDSISIHSSNRRRGPDLILRLLDILSVFLVFFTIAVLFIILYAKPQWETFFDRLFHTSVREYWDYRFLRLALSASVVEFFISIISLYLNSKRLKREGDRIRNPIVISIFASIIFFTILAFVVWR